MATNPKAPSASFNPGHPDADPRGSLREGGDDSQFRAAMRVAELRGNFAGGVLDEGTDDFYVDPSVIPAGWSYEWKMLTVLGKEDPAYQVSLARTGWEAVPAKRHPEMMPHDYKEAAITRRGMILMERPKEITDEARNIEKKRARDQVRIKEDQLASAPQGQFSRDNKGSSLASVKRGYSPTPVPE